MAIRKWPYGFLDEFWDYDDNDAPEITDDAELTGSVEYVLAVAKISDREKDILRMHYKDGMTYTAIAESLNLSPSRIAELGRKSMSRIRRWPQYRAILSIGVAAYTRRRYDIQKDAAFQEALAEKIKEVRLSDCRYFAKRYGIEEEELTKRIDPPAAPKPKNVSLIELDLSVRSYNALRRSGHNSAADILAHKDKQELMDIRNFGESSYKEVMRTLEKKGFDVRHLCA